eukprot:8982849-Pyramimonas_sp.AAC.1
MATRTPSSTRGRSPCSRLSSMSAYCNIVTARAGCRSGSRAGWSQWCLSMIVRQLPGFGNIAFA